MAILSGPPSQPGEAKPIIHYDLHQRKPWHFHLSGRYEGGQLDCMFAPSSDNWFKKLNMIGKLEVNSGFIGNLKVIASADSQVLMVYEADNNQYTLAANRNLIGPGSDITIVASDYGPIAKILRWDNPGWREQYESKFGFGTVQRGLFLTDKLHSSTANLSAATVVLLALYFQLIEHLLNTDSAS